MPVSTNRRHNTKSVLAPANTIAATSPNHHEPQLTNLRGEYQGRASNQNSETKSRIQSSSKATLVAGSVTERQAGQLPAGCALASCGQSILAPRFPTFFSLTLHGTSAALTKENGRCKQGLESYEPHWPIHGLSLDNFVLFCVAAVRHGARTVPRRTKVHEFS